MRKNERDLILLFLSKIENAQVQCNREIWGYLHGIRGIARDGTRDQTDSGRASSVLQEPDRQPDPQAAGPVEPPPHRDRRPKRSKHPLDTDYWTYSGYRGEFNCPHGIGHGNHVHGCDGCCKRDDFPLKELSPCPHCGSRKYTPGGGYCDSCGGAF